MVHLSIELHDLKTPGLWGARLLAAQPVGHAAPPATEEQRLGTLRASMSYKSPPHGIKSNLEV